MAQNNPIGKTSSISTEEESKENRGPKRKMKSDFFSIGHSAASKNVLPDDEIENKDEVWRNIKPNQCVDALNKEVYKKRKYEEFQQRRQKQENRPKNKWQSKYQANKRPKITPEMEEK